jgi:xanthosine utilization system XapX-like protein
MRVPILAGLIAGVIFGIVAVLEGAGAAGLVLLFGLVGMFISVVVWLVWRIINGEVDAASLRSLVEEIFSGRSQDRR